MHLVLVAAAVAAASAAAAATETAIWGQAYGGDAGRSYQSGTLGPRFPGGSGTPSPVQPAGVRHVLDVVWRWQLPTVQRQDTSMFYYGGVDSAGDVYYLRTANGALSHYVYKVSGADGSLLWTSTPPPTPYYANYYGADHLIVHANDAVYVIAGTTYTLADCAWIQRLNAKTGAQDWWLNGTATVANAILSSDGGTLYAAFANNTIAAIDAATGTVNALWDSAVSILPAPPSVNFGMTLATGVTTGDGQAAEDVILLSATNLYAAVSTTNGSLMWTRGDPLGGSFTPPANMPRPGTPFAGQAFVSEGGNYGDGQGVAAMGVANGTTSWVVNISSVVSSMDALAHQGWQWNLQWPSSGTYATVSVRSLATGAQLANPAYFTAFSFTSNPVVSDDGACMYVFGSGPGGLDHADELLLLSFCFNGTAITAEYSVPLSGVNAPNHQYQLSTGPAPGQLTLWHDAGLMVVQAYAPLPPPPVPAPPKAPTGELVAFVIGKTTDTCSYGGGNVTLQAASLVPGGSTSGSAAGGATAAVPEWVLGPVYTGMDDKIAGNQCSTSGNMAVDAAGRRAWVQFSCYTPGIGRYTAFVAQLALGAAPGDAPTVSKVCQAGSATSGLPGTGLYFSAGVNASAPFYLDAWGEFDRRFFALTVPDPSPGPGGYNPPLCIPTVIGELYGGTALIPRASSWALDEEAPGGGVIMYAASITDWGIRIIGFTAPGGVGTNDITLPCDTAICGGGNILSTAVRNAKAVLASTAPYFADWQPTPVIGQGLTVGSSDTWTGLVNAAEPTFPLLYPGGIDALPSPSDVATGADVWLQQLYTGPTVCTNATVPGLLRNIAVYTQPALQANSSTMVTNVTVPACPLPLGEACYSVSVGHLQAFAA